MTCKYNTSLCGHTICAETAPQNGAKPCALSWLFARHATHKELRNSNMFHVSYTCKLSPRKFKIEVVHFIAHSDQAQMSMGRW